MVEESTFPVHKKINKDMDDIDEDDEVIIFLDEIIRYRMIPRRTNWRYRYLALNQQEVAAVSSIQLSISELTDFFLVLVLLVNQLLTVLHSSTRRNADQNVPLRQQMAPVIRFYSRLLAFCYLRLDDLILEEHELVGITRGEWEAAVAREADTPPRNRSIEALSEGDAHRLTRFRKEQLQVLMVHWRIPAQVVTARNRYVFTGEEMLIVCLTRLATGWSWTQLSKDVFGGNPRRWSPLFHWFVDFLFVNFYHKISGRSIEMWLDQLDEFKQAILNRLAQPAHPIEQELFNLDGHPERAQYVLHCDPEHWRIFGFLDDTNVRSCRLGSGPVGPEEGAGRPRRAMAYEIQRAFYRLVRIIYFFL